MLLRVKNLTEHYVVLDSSTGLILENEEEYFDLTTAEFESIADSLLELEQKFIIEYDTFFVGDPRNDIVNREYVDNAVLAASGALGVYIFRPGEPTPTGAVFNDWSNLMAQVALAGGGQILLDGSLSGGTVVLETGSYDLSNVTLTGSGSRTPTLVIPDGFVLSEPVFRAENVDIDLQISTDLVSVGVGEEGIVALANSTVTANSAGELLSAVTGSGDSTILLTNSTFLTGAGDLVSVGVGELVQLTAVNSVVQNDTLSGAGDIDVYADLNSTISTTQTAHTGTLTILQGSISVSGSNVSFDDFNVLPSLAATTPPARDTVQKAIDWFKEDMIKSSVITRNMTGTVTNFQKGTDPIWTLTRDMDGRVTSLTNGILLKTVNRDGENRVTGVTVTVL